MAVAGTRVLIVMGVAGTGKSTLARALADALNWPFQEGDDLHSPSNITKMAAGQPLTDEDRAPWLQAVRSRILGLEAVGQSGIVTCSALKRQYRDLLSGQSKQVAFIALEGDEDLLRSRLRHRAGHFMPDSLLDSQLADYEPPQPDEKAIMVRIERTVEEQVACVIRALNGGTPHYRADAPHSGDPT